MSAPISPTFGVGQGGLLCERYRRTVGNAYTDGITELISGDAAVELRAETFGCKRNCSFIYKRGAADYVRLAKVMRH